MMAQQPARGVAPYNLLTVHHWDTLFLTLVLL